MASWLLVLGTTHWPGQTWEIRDGIATRRGATFTSIVEPDLYTTLARHHGKTDTKMDSFIWRGIIVDAMTYKPREASYPSISARFQLRSLR